MIESFLSYCGYIRSDFSLDYLFNTLFSALTLFFVLFLIYSFFLNRRG